MRRRHCDNFKYYGCLDRNTSFIRTNLFMGACSGAGIFFLDCPAGDRIKPQRNSSRSRYLSLQKNCNIRLRHSGEHNYRRDCLLNNT